jgi:hypothetical protein
MNARAERFFQQRLCASFQGGQEHPSPHIIHFMRASAIGTMTHPTLTLPVIERLAACRKAFKTHRAAIDFDAGFLNAFVHVLQSVIVDN